MNREFWDEVYREDADSVIIVDRILDSEVEGLAPGRALDLGCGTGLNALMLAQRGWSVLGVDWAEHAIELATEVVSSRGLDAQFVFFSLGQLFQPGERIVAGGHRSLFQPVGWSGFGWGLWRDLERWRRTDPSTERILQGLAFPETRAYVRKVLALRRGAGS